MLRLIFIFGAKKQRPGWYPKTLHACVCTVNGSKPIYCVWTDADSISYFIKQCKFTQFPRISRRLGLFLFPAHILHTFERAALTGKRQKWENSIRGSRCEAPPNSTTEVFDLFNSNPYFPQAIPQGPAFQRPAYQPQQMYQQPMNQPMSQPMMQDGMVQARFVASREEAVAATVIPGSMFLFFDRANRKIYSKLIDPKTGMPDFKEFSEMQPEQQQAPQYATLEAVGAALQELEQRVDQKISALTAPKQASRKVVANDE